MGLAAADLLMDAACASFPSQKDNRLEIVLKADGDGLRFGLSKEEVADRREQAIAETQRALTKLAPMLALL